MQWSNLMNWLYYFWKKCRHARRKFGLLEKHKDYAIRAKAYHKKEQALQVIRCLCVHIWCLIVYVSMHAQ